MQSDTTSTVNSSNLLRGIEQAAGTGTGVSTLILLYGISAVAQGLAFVSAIPIFRYLLGQESLNPPQIVLFAACILVAFLAHITGLAKSSRISVYAVCDRIVQRIGSKVTRIALGRVQRFCVDA